MMNIRKLSVALVAVFIMVGFAYNNDRLYEISKNIEIFVNVYKEINTNYVDDVDPSTLMRTGIDAMLKSLDPYTNYISESQVESYRISDQGTYDGLGAKTKPIDGIMTITEPLEGGAAFTAGLKAGDQVLEVNGLSTEGRSSDDLERIARGVKGTEVQLKVKKYGSDQPEYVNVKRTGIEIPNVPYEGIVKDGIGYIALTTFTANAGRNVAKALKKLKRENKELKGVILDLRQNGGGLLREAIGVSNVFINQGEEIVSTKGKIRERDQFYKTTAPPTDLDIPLAVLIDKKSASASEIVSGTIQDLDRGVIIGQRSYGKGLVQNTMEVGYQSRVKVTISKYYIPSGRCIQSVDYEGGEPKEIPDSERNTFYTRNKRPVLDGGGVTPDIKMVDPLKNELIAQLMNDDIIFKYINLYCSQRDSIEAIGEYKFEDYNNFVAFAKAELKSSKSEGMKKLDELEEHSKEAGLSSIETEISAIRSKLLKYREDGFMKYESEISNLLESEIVTRYYNQRGKKEQQLLGDDVIDEAVRILSNAEEYNKILKG